MRWLIAFISLAVFWAVYIYLNIDRISVWLCGYLEVIEFAFILYAKRNWFGLGSHAQLQIILLVVMIPAIITLLTISVKLVRFISPSFVRRDKSTQDRSFEAGVFLVAMVIAGRLPHYIWRVKQAIK